jgi:hypothetical protein
VDVLSFVVRSGVRCLIAFKVLQEVVVSEYLAVENKGNATEATEMDDGFFDSGRWLSKRILVQ